MVDFADGLQIKDTLPKNRIELRVNIGLSGRVALLAGELPTPRKDLVGIYVELAGKARYRRPLDKRLFHDGTLELHAVLPVGAALGPGNDWLNFCVHNRSCGHNSICVRTQSCRR